MAHKGSLILSDQKLNNRISQRRTGVRRITNGCRKNIGKFPSLKNGRAVWYESLLERDFMFLLEIDPDVVSYKEQPTTIRFRAGDDIYTYTPDFLVVRKKTMQIVEVKPAERVKEEKYQTLFQHAREIFRKWGYEFVVVTESVIHKQPLLDNVKLLHKYSRTPISCGDQLEAHNFLAGKDRSTLSEISKHFVSKGKPKQVIYALIYFGIVSADLGAASLGPGLTVRLPLRVSGKEKKIA
jgi:TnsA-like endonuclease N terminal